MNCNVIHISTYMYGYCSLDSDYHYSNQCAIIKIKMEAIRKVSEYLTFIIKYNLVYKFLNLINKKYCVYV